jgi:CIC family chloride channel protein
MPALSRPPTRANPTSSHDPAKTGFFKPLPPAGRAARLWSKLGLMLGQKMANVVRDDHVFLLLMAVLVGVTAGGAAGLLLLWIDRARELFPSGSEQPGWEWLFLLLAPVLGGLAVGGLRVLIRRRRPNFIGGIPSVLASVSKTNRPLEGVDAALLGLGSGVTIASGGSVGHEAPTVAIGATVGSVVARFFGLRQRRQIAMLGAGCAAGLAAAFNAPLAGVIFTVEVVFKRTVQTVGAMSVFTPLILAAVAGTFTSYMIFGERTEFAEHVARDGGISLTGMIFVLLLAVAAGALSPLMSRAIIVSSRLFARLKVPVWAKPALGGLGLGLLGLLVFTGTPIFSDILGPGRLTVAEALQNNLGWKLALALLALKLIATALTIGSGGMGGVFMPSLFMGACLGTVVHAFAQLIFGDAVGPAGAYALVGMGAYLGATLRAPLTPIVMIFEFTHDYGLILPLMFACILSAFVATRVQKDTLFDLQLGALGIRTEDGHEREVMTAGRVEDLMAPPKGVVASNVDGHEVRRACLSEDRANLYVVDDEQRIAGVIDARDIAARVLAGEFDDSMVAGELLLTRRPAVLFASDSLAGAMTAFSQARLETLPVVDHDRHIVGLLRRSDLISHYNERVLQARDSDLQISGGFQGQDQEVGLGAGIVLERIVVGRAWAGKTLAELDLRRTHSVQVLEWRRDLQIMSIDPHRPLREADVLALAGSREHLLNARWTH